MKKVNRVVLMTAFLFGAITVSFGQQEAQYTQFFYNKLPINPGYAGSQLGPCFSLLYRQQWLGLEGAPESQVFNFHTSAAANRLGLGVNIHRFSIGITESLTFNTVYAYKLLVGQGTLSMGLSAGLRWMTVDYSDDRLVSTQPIGSDDLITGMKESKILPNFGAGIYYRSASYFLGISVPRILQNNLKFNETVDVLSKEIRHLFVMGGLQMKSGDNLLFQPSILLKLVKDAPFDMDVNFSAILKEKYHLGITYRLGGNRKTGFGESIDILAGLHLGEHLFTGLSYDLTLSDIKDYDNGSLEVFLRYCLSKETDNEIINPRFF